MTPAAPISTRTASLGSGTEVAPAVLPVDDELDEVVVPPVDEVLVMPPVLVVPPVLVLL